MTGAALGLVRVIASLINEPRPDSDAQRPIGDSDAASQPLALPAPGVPTSREAAAAELGGGMQPSDDAHAPLVAAEASPATAPAGEQRTAANAGTQQTEYPPVGQAEAAPGADVQPTSASALVASADRGMPPAEPPGATAPSADVADDSRHMGTATMPASLVLPLEAPLAALEAGLDAQQPPPKQEQTSNSASMALQPPKVEPPEADVTAASPSATPAAPLPDEPALPQTAEAADAQQAVAVVPSGPPRPQPPPPAQLLLLSEDASVGEVQAAALGTFRELYPIFEPFAARSLKPAPHRVAAV